MKELTREYGLLESGDMKLNTQMELSTLFFEHCWRVYAKVGGTVAFVMPRSVITGAKQHRAFQRGGFSRVLDFKGVAPLFNVETCVMIRQPGKLYTDAIPIRAFSGLLPAHECRLDEAHAHLDEVDGGTTDFVGDHPIASPYYHPRFKQGATLVPRNLTFVTSAQPGLAPGALAQSSIMRTDPDVDADAKAPWKGLSLQGHLDADFLYATLLSKNLVPFGIRRLHLVALPMRVGLPAQVTAAPGQARERRFLPMSLAEMRDSITYARSADDWFAKAEKLWNDRRKSVDMNLWERANYQQGVTGQSAEPGYLVIYNAEGSNLAACIVDANNLPIVNGVQPKGFVTEHVMYWCRVSTLDEAHFLSAIFNSPSVSEVIKPHQPRGLYGPRHIQRIPLEVCAIPQFDASNADHQRLAVLSEAAHATVAGLDLSQGGVVATRKKAREATRTYLEQIDVIARRLLGLTDVPITVTVPDDDAEIEEEESDL